LKSKRLIEQALMKEKNLLVSKIININPKLILFTYLKMFLKFFKYLKDQIYQLKQNNSEESNFTCKF